MPSFKVLLTVLLAQIAVLATASDQLDSGRALYQPCAGCHGPAGEGNTALGAPRLAHLEPLYVESQLEKFLNGQRGGAGSSAGALQMAAMAGTVATPESRAAVAAYVASLDGAVSPVTVEGDISLGGDFYNQMCGACHGARAEGNPALKAPALIGSDDWYLVAQLQAFRSGTRGTHSDDRSGRQMRAMAAVLPDDQALANVVAFIRSLAE